MNFFLFSDAALEVLVEVTRYTQAKRKEKAISTLSTFVKIIRPNTKISRYSIKLELKEFSRNVALFCFFLFSYTHKKKMIDLSKGTSNYWRKGNSLQWKKIVSA